jgi:membrane-bound ClpP family serine protease
MIILLTWISIFTGGLLILLFLLSFVGGLDFDTEVGSADGDGDAGGIGIIKGLLIFISVGSWVMKIMLGSDQNPAIAAGIGVVSGLIAFFILSQLFKLLLRNQENVNWSMEDTMFAKGQVYLRIPAGGDGIVNIEINGVNREVKAKSKESQEITTGTLITVVDIEGEFVYVESESNH